MNKIISFSLYGTAEKYYTGAFKNAYQIKYFLPQWDMRVYYHSRLTNLDAIERLKNQCECIMVDDLLPESHRFTMFWRYLPFFGGEMAIARDLDSRFSDREVRYINGWEANGKPVFVIRDHPWQSLYPGGLIGFNDSDKSGDFYNYFLNFSKTQDGGYGKDQEFLHTYVTQTYSTDHIHNCSIGGSEFIPRTNRSFFIGMQLDENDEPICTKANQYLLDLNL